MSGGELTTQEFFVKILGFLVRSHTLLVRSASPESATVWCEDLIDQQYVAVFVLAELEFSVDDCKTMKKTQDQPCLF
jgi:hypothetical protein